MIRRFPVALISVALTVTLASGCTTISDNKVAASVGDNELAVDDVADLTADFATLTTDPQYLADDRGDLSGDSVRFAIERWIHITAAANGLADAGVELDDAALEKSESAWIAEQPELWSQLSPVTQSMLIEYRAVADALTANPDVLTDEFVQAAYSAGPGTSGVICLRVIVADADTDAADVDDQLQNGADFAELANSVNADDLGLAPGGVLVDPNTGAECAATSSLPDDILAAVSELEIGEPSGPIAGGTDRTFFIVQRDFSEVSDSVRQAITANALDVATQVFAGGADVRVDSRYGMWSADTKTVEPTR